MMALNFRTADDGNVEVTGFAEKAQSVTVLMIPDTFEGRKVTSIGAGAFSHCRNLEEVVLPPSLETIGMLAFFRCTSLTGISIPASVSYIDDSAFDSCERLGSISVSEENESFTSIDGVLFSRDAKTVLRYPEGRKASCYEIPEGTLEIGNRAFNCSVNLESVHIPGSVWKIGMCAFDGCRKLEDVVLNEGLDWIERWAFRFTGIRSITIPGSVSCIEEEVFCGTENLSSISTMNNPYFSAQDGVLFDSGIRLLTAVHSMTGHYRIPEGTETIGAYAFSGCGLETVEIPSSVITIEEGAFSGCEKLKKIFIPDSVMVFGSRCFENCTSLETVRLSACITVMPDYMFLHCIKLKKVNLPDSLRVIGSGAFGECLELSGIDLPEGVETIRGGAFTGTSVHGITVSQNVGRIGCWAFSHCDSLEELVIPDGVTEIEHNTFRHCSSLKKVVLGSNVTTVDVSAFEECPFLEELVIDMPEGSVDLSHLNLPENCSVRWSKQQIN